MAASSPPSSGFVPDIDAAHGRAMTRRMYEIAHDFVDMVDELASEFGIATRG